MLSRKSEMCGSAGVAAAVDRGRVAERLRAAVAGLQELQHLREKQGDMVLRALRTGTDTDTGTDTGTESEHGARDVCMQRSDEETSRAEEKKRLEATLTALKQQLTRLRRQDVGLKTHLLQLDQQISELKLDECKASAEHLESDSRPSSGFFELSDGGLGSLSNSCTSVYSECLSTSSQASLLPRSSGSSAAQSLNAQIQADVCRRRSADETTAQPDVPRGIGVRLGSSGIRTGSISLERARQRPVSTGDLDRVINPNFGNNYKPSDVQVPTLSSKFCDPTVDPKYHSNLVSRNGTEVYCYPSPLHAVALQSPIFCLTGENGGNMTTDAQEKHMKMGLSKDTLPKQESSVPKPEGYIVKLLQRSSSKMSLHSELGLEKDQIPNNFVQDQGLSEFSTKQMYDDMQGSLPWKIESSENLVRDRKKLPSKPADKEQTNLNSIRTGENRQMCLAQHSSSTGNQKPTAVMGQEKVVENELRDRPDQGNGFEDASAVAKAPGRRSSFTFSNEENKSSNGGCTKPAKSEFVCAQFVPAGSQRVKVRQADKKTKAVKPRRKGHEKTAAKKHHLKHSSREHEKDKGYSTKTGGDKNPKQFIAGREWIDAHHIEPRFRSCSESSLLRPSGTHLQSFRQQKHTSKSYKPPKAQFPDFENQPRKKQSSQKWPQALEVQLPIAPPTHYQRSREVPVHRVSQKPGMVRSLSMRPRSGHWGGFPCPLQPSLSSSSYFSNLNLKYPPAPLSTHYPPRCESEYSAECASLFHSTIVESSEGELSDYTTNRFGDSESSQESQTGSDSDSSLSLDEDDLYEEDEDEGGLVWAEATVGPSIQQHLRPEPASCRIKASRALKKKIRRFQPASLKVMTLV